MNVNMKIAKSDEILLARIYLGNKAQLKILKYFPYDNTLTKVEYYIE
jgi:hypothetical protein